ncbi:neutral sphingomyelinase [Theileria orientalis strain Shintoku]|uniref:Neutral sphingomyelinase n=1 Tax=Theileria orientalis strain Shintoku TaxID=869250 RepID=J4D943_THEOR|nr:neutral sphingomyelinase [Theileria orientalis strain Shintoku]BAM41180.1 neutral sphingomyelinase [Theileria orientalis strain Shintoku]|eukprot:XP_009691481.1 neutral sphingomyelinase [Theileria orientalis strain Shintoku]
MLSTVRSFDLVLLEEGEEYVTDAACNSFTLFPSETNLSNWAKFLESATEPQNVASVQVSRKGRIRVGTKSLIFEPDALDMPLLKLQFQHITTISEFPKNPCGYKKLFYFNNLYGNLSYNMLKDREIFNMSMNYYRERGFSTNLIPNREKLLLGGGKESIYCWRLKRMVRHGGFCALTDKAIYFQPCPNFSRKLYKRINLDNILHVFKRDSGLTTTGECSTALEVVSLPEELDDNIARKQYRCIYLEFNLGSDREKLVGTLKTLIPRSFYAIESRAFRNEMTELWRMGLLPNFQYLDFLNCIAGRSRYDISHYPVFPWILSDYSSQNLDLNDPKVFRDLSKPIGALNEERLQLIKKRMYNLYQLSNASGSHTVNKGNKANKQKEQHQEGAQKRMENVEGLWNMGYYLYGSHYSTPALIVFFLIRLLPECQLRLYGGRFDSAARTFKNIQETFQNTYSGHSSFFELIPEFYENNELFLKNTLNITTQDGRLGDVELPKWAHNNPCKFLKTMRLALESEYVSKNLTNWIDLIFGYKQTGQNSILNNNTYHPLTYLGSVHAGKLKPSTAISNFLRTMDSQAISVQVREFGQSPIILFDTPHPRKIVFNEFNFDDAYNSAPWFIYVEKHSELFTKGGLEISDSFRLNRTIVPTYGTGHLREISELVSKDKLNVMELPRVDKVTNLGFLSDYYYYLTSQGVIHFRKFRAGTVSTEFSDYNDDGDGDRYGENREEDRAANNLSNGVNGDRDDAYSNKAYYRNGMNGYNDSDELEESGLERRKGYSKVLNVSKYSLTCGICVNKSLFTADTCGYLHMINYAIISNDLVGSGDSLKDLENEYLSVYEDDFCYMPRGSTNVDKGRHFTTYVSSIFSLRGVYAFIIMPHNNMSYIRIFAQLHDDSVTCIDYEDGYLVTGGLDETVRRFQLTSTGLHEVMIFDESAGLTCLCCKNDLLLSCVVNGKLNLWDIRTPNTPIWSYEPTTDKMVLSCGISNHFIQVVSKSRDPVVFWDIRMLNSLGSCDSFMKQLNIDYVPLSSYCDPGDHISLTAVAGPAASNGCAVPRADASTLHESIFYIYDLSLKNRVSSLALGLKNPTMTCVNPFSQHNNLRAIVANNRGDSVAIYD